MKIVLLVVLLLGLTECMSVSEQPEFEVVVVVVKEGDVVETAVSTNTVIFDITSQSGIGSAEVKLASGTWPKTILFRLHLTGLEEFRFEYGDTIVTASVNSSGGHVVLESMVQDGEERPIAEDSSFYMPVRIEMESGEVTIPLKDGYLEVEAPADFYVGDYDSFALSWIDFYR